MSLAGKTILITGASRGIGQAMAYRFAQDHANLVLVGKTVESHPKFGGSVHETAAGVEERGGRPLALPCDVRDEKQIENVVQKAIDRFGGIDIVINNAGAIALSSAEQVTTKHYDLMMDINVRGAFLCAQKSLPHLKKSKEPHVIFLAPPLNLKSKWFKKHSAYTVSKYAMSMLSYGLSQEWADHKIHVNSVWPKTTIATAAVKMLGGDQAMMLSRSPEFVAEAVYQVLSKRADFATGEALLDDDILEKSGVSDYKNYQKVPTDKLLPDLFVD